MNHDYFLIALMPVVAYFAFSENWKLIKEMKKWEAHEETKTGMRVVQIGGEIFLEDLGDTT